MNYQGSTTVEGRQLYEAFVLILPPFLTPSCLPHHPIEDPWGRPVGTLGQPLREIFEDPLVTVPRDPSTFSGTAIGDTLMWVLRVQVPSEEVLGSLGSTGMDAPGVTVLVGVPFTNLSEVPVSGSPSSTHLGTQKTVQAVSIVKLIFSLELTRK